MARLEERWRISYNQMLNCLHLARYTLFWHPVFERGMKPLLVWGSIHSIPTICVSYLQRIQTLRDCSVGLGELRRSARLNLLQLSCGQINDLLSSMALELANVITTHLIEDNREKNKE